ncbi:MAG: hypothetical protein JXA89_22235 [Anaerolineae bacterium]|nr:hypothetical protein [Anaerolineae bacterium]
MKRLVFVLIAISLLLLPSTVMAKKDVGTVWYVPGDFPTIQEAIDSTDVVDGDIIFVGPGSYAGAYVSKAVEIKGQDGAVIDDGPAHSSGLIMGFRLLAGSDGTVISHLGFTVDLAIMNGDAVNNVIVTHCTFNNTIQAISNWRGSGWTIAHNKIVDLRTHNGGGIGILVGDYAGTEAGVKNNVISHNTITGVLHVDPADGGGYNGSGIVLYADFRWGMPGAVEISGNRVVQNKVSITSDTPEVVDIAAIEITDSRDDDAIDPVIFDNAIGFNDLRGTTLQIVLTPESLAEVNEISRNLGDNRGHGPHPSLFGPGG